MNRRRPPYTAHSYAGKRHVAGFTIVEMMIATLIFSVILLVITTGVLSFTNGYYKGINASTTQSLTQSASDAVSQAIQFEAGSVNLANEGAAAGYVCIGTKEFAYTLGDQLVVDGGGAQYLLYEFTPGASGCEPISSPATSTPGWSTGRELLGPHTRLAYFKVANTIAGSNLYSVSIRVAYGGGDLLCVPNAASGIKCSAPAPSSPGPALFIDNTLACRADTGSQFCAVSGLQTIVEKRIQ